MRQLNKNLLRALCTLSLLAVLALPALAAEKQENLKVYPVETQETAAPQAQTLTARQVRTTEIPSFTSSDAVLELIKKYEGFSPVPIMDTDSLAIGYGSRYSAALEKWPGCTSITQEQALELVRDDLVSIENYLNSFFRSNGILLNQNQFDALVDFTYNVGIGWTTYRNEDGTWCLLKQMLLDDPATWTEERAQASFGTWVKANGEVLQGLVKRRAEEATLFVSPCEGVVFRDVPAREWYYTWVMSAYELQLMRGHGDGTFGPENPMTRAEMVQALVNLSGADVSGYSGSSFTDVSPEEWYAPAVAWAVEQGLVNGNGDGTFSPEEPISRQHACSVFARYLRKLGFTAGSADPFVDDGLMEETSRGDVYYCAALGLVNGVGDGYFDPQGITTRGQAAKLLVGIRTLIQG